MAAYHTSLDLQTYWLEMFKFLIASLLVRGSACTINDIFDRNFDAGVGVSHLLSHCPTPISCHYRAHQGTPSCKRARFRLCCRRLSDPPIRCWRSYLLALQRRGILGCYCPASSLVSVMMYRIWIGD